VERVVIIESFSGIMQGDSLKSFLFVLAHYWTFLEIIMQILGYIFPTLVNNILVVGPLNEIIHAFDHLLT
jgi:hypothetical protein